MDAYNPILIGVVHADGTLPHCIEATEELKRGGITTLGLEKGLSEKQVAILHKNIIDPVMNHPNIPDFYKGLFFLHTPTADDYFAKIKEHAEKLGIKVVDIDSGFAHMKMAETRLDELLLGTTPDSAHNFFGEYLT